MSGPQPHYGHPNPQQPQYPQQPAYPQQPQYWQYQQPREGIAVNTGYSPLAWAFAMVKPKIVVNGAETSTSTRRTFLPSRVGPADITVNVAPGHVVELEYKAPVWTFSPGSLGAPPQTYNGQTAMIVVTIVTIVALVMVFGAMFILALAGSV
jgi:hypothetical protein